MFKKFFVLILFFFSVTLVAQKFQPQLQTSEVITKTSEAFEDNLNILAVMVEFQPDDFELTYGDGTFGSIYSKDYGNNIIDPLPHDKNYFEDHLQFAVNYYNKVSNGNVSIDFTVLPNVYTVSNPMREYSPVGDESFKVLGDFSQEVWDLVSKGNPSFDFSVFNTFIIFHAGVGKDISTSDLFGEARDLPSIYLGERSLKSFYGDTFNGFPLSDGSLVNHTIILPETESREESGFGEVALLELSINGLLVSSIASHLGLPDLFDAETGKSAIGRFGLMDGQSLFAYAGLFPPQPSAWEKIYLGWETPTIVNSNSTNINVVARQIAQANQNTIIKIPINSSEYYLVENRARDANNDGVTITYKVGGQVRTINFTEDLDNFNNAFVDTLKGVVLDVDEFDWAVPGNGILIWHIDEKIANQENITANRVNIGENRGVDLEEADGIQDIGEEFQTIFGDIIIAEGEEFDFWYSTNPSRLYQNRFGADTKPNTMTNNGANSLITFSNFSNIANEMSFDVSFSNTDMKFVYQSTIDVDHQTSPEFVKLNSIVDVNDNTVYVMYLGDLFILNANGVTIKKLDRFGNTRPAVINLVGNKFVVGVESYYEASLVSNLNIYDQSLDSVFTIKFSPAITSVPVLKRIDDNNFSIIIGGGNGEGRNIKTYNVYKSNELEIKLVDSIMVPNIGAIERICYSGEDFIATSLPSHVDNLGNVYDFEKVIYDCALTQNKDGELVSVVLTAGNHIYILKHGEVLSDFIISDLIADIRSFSLADLFKDGENYILVNNFKSLDAYNFSGVLAKNFPFADPANYSSFNHYSSPISFDYNNDGNTDILTSTLDGRIFVVSGNTGKVQKGFPISIDSRMSVTPVISKASSGGSSYLTVISDNHDLYQWEMLNTGELFWSSEYGNQQNSGFIKAAVNNNIVTTFFPINKTYNWPNPVYGDETYIRTYIAEDAKVKVKIFDLAGDLVDEFQFNATGGRDAEYAWNVSNIQSGAYFAHLEVKSNSGKTKSKIIKIAVIK